LEEYFDDVIELSGRPFGGKMLYLCKSGKKHHCRPPISYKGNSSIVESCSKLSYEESWKNEHAMERDMRVIERALGVQLPRSIPIFPMQNAEFPVLVPPIQEPFAVFQTRSDDPKRTWPRDRWKTLAKRILEEGTVKEIVIPFGSVKEGYDAAWIADGISGCRIPCGRLPFDVHAALVQKAVVCVTCNTGVMHVAAAVKKTPIVAVWGNTKIKKWYPLCDRFRIVCRNKVFNEDGVRRMKVDSKYQEGPIKANLVHTVACAIAKIL
jgi:ADP-heptose:LPS heptosyltransferase